MTTDPQTEQTTMIVSVPNHPDKRELRVVSLSGNQFGYRCNACGGKRDAYFTRKAAEDGARQHECPDADAWS